MSLLWFPKLKPTQGSCLPSCNPSLCLRFSVPSPGFYFDFNSCSDFWVAQRLKRLPPTRETWVQSLGREDPLEKEMATHSSILAWRIPWTEEPGRLQSMGSQSRTRLSDFTSPQWLFTECTASKYVSRASEIIWVWKWWKLNHFASGHCWLSSGLRLILNSLCMLHHPSVWQEPTK